MMPAKIDRVNYGQLTFVDWWFSSYINANLKYTIRMTSLKKDKRNNFHDDCTFISSDSEHEDYEEPQSVNRVYD